MNKYHVTYYYLATGMEGIADSADYGIVEAESAEQAKEIIGYRLSPEETNKSYREWGLSARLVEPNCPTCED